MQSTLVKHNKFFKAGHATSFDTAKKYAVRCDGSSSEHGSVPSPGLITTGDFAFVINFRIVSVTNLAAFGITHGCRIEFMRHAVAMRITIEDDSSSVNFVTNNDLTDGEWHTIIISCDRDGDLDYYEDYNAIGGGYTESLDISGVTGNIEDAGTNHWFFCYNNGVYNSLDFDQIAFFSQKLTPTQAVAIYNSLQQGFEVDKAAFVPDPMCYYKCNEGTGTTVANEGSTAGSHNMTLYNTPTWITDGMI